MIHISNEISSIKVGLTEEEYFELLNEVYKEETDLREKIIAYYKSLNYKEKEIFRLIGPDFILQDKDEQIKFLLMIKIHDVDNFRRIIDNAREKILKE
ncbi:hypothetical protein DLH72_04875 [Candidatus Gracilibacteria bacterium]|nr:MAG: hypothetical protein DLH72_04875 [Candidatus Gracilibacteria bacterium]